MDNHSRRNDTSCQWPSTGEDERTYLEKGKERDKNRAAELKKGRRDDEREEERKDEEERSGFDLAMALAAACLAFCDPASVTTTRR